MADIMDHLRYFSDTVIFFLRIDVLPKIRPPPLLSSQGIWFIFVYSMATLNMRRQVLIMYDLFSTGTQYESLCAISCPC